MENNIRKSMYEKNLYEKVKSGLKKALITYCILGTIYGLGEETTGHMSSDISTGRHNPTKIEKIVYEDWLGVDLSHYPKQK